MPRIQQCIEGPPLLNNICMQKTMLWDKVGNAAYKAVWY